MLATLSLADKNGMIHKAICAIILCLCDKVIPEATILTQFNKIIDDLKNIKVKLDDENKNLILLSSLPRSFELYKDALLYGKEDNITLEEVQ
ncbi:cytochrome P450 [Trifolium medium]|uniref:Cytochrome P450 n=1 Tax=Trifolium medium TaxID=97028 RepID=A0A392MBI9_9FABA|nr:cytochrome P450 [Trifolium medium]